MYRKNVASQHLPFCLVNASSGAALTGATVTARRSLDGAAQASATGSVSELGNGQYNLALSQADTNGNQIGILLTATNAIPVHFTLVTTAADPTDPMRFGLTALPNAAAGAATGLITAGATGNVLPTDAITAASIAADAIGAAEIANGAIDAATFATGAITAATFAAGAIDAAAIATDAITNAELSATAVTEIQAGLATSAEIAAVQADTDNIQTRLPTALVGGRMDSSVGAIAAGTVTAAAYATGAIDANALAASAVAEIQAGLATPAQVNAEVLDVLNVDTFAELASIPAAATTLTNMLRILYAFATNELRQTATLQTLRNRADSATIGTAAVSDDSTTFTRDSFA